MIEYLRNIVRRFRRSDSGLPDESPEELEALFKSRYMNFKLLLAANNKALELMAEMEAALSAGRTFGMSFIRSHATALSVAVYQMIKNLAELAPAKYETLYDRHKSIQDELNRILAESATPVEGRPILFFEEIDRNTADLTGAKMANLGEVKNKLNLPVPPGFVITTEAYRRFFEENRIQAEINRLIQAATVERMDHLFALSTDIRQLIVKADLPRDLEDEIMAAYRKLEEQAGRGVNVSLRSSALGEDAVDASFAGQYTSQLNVRAEFIPQAYKEVIAGKYTPQAMHYRFMRGLRDEDVAMCVGCLAMVEAVSGGVAYSRSALDPADSRIHVSSAWGLPKAVVDGSAAVDLFVVNRSNHLEIVSRRIERKEDKFQCFPGEGVCRMVTTGEEAEKPSVGDEAALKVAELALRLEEHYGTAQDVEWAEDETGRIVILQCRPLRPAISGQSEARRVGVEAEALLSGGIMVSPGAASGPVFPVLKDGDALRLPEGAILVLPQPLPRWAALLGRASAVIAETGGLAGHLATVAREYRLPALFGLKGAVENLPEGELVTLDADGLTVYRGRVESLLAGRPKAKNFMEGSPVYNILKKAVALVAPLNLLDPDSTGFRAGACKTFHDLTRFCHEMSVREMFDFGKDHHFPIRSGKQLYYRVPMQWWILNLEDGFREEVAGKYVKLEEIASIPMLAVWEGMTVIPWQGPPAVSGKGLASVLFEATRNPALGTPFKTAYTNKNYFMISKNFMNLQSRFGFHFCAVEALVGERRRENYITFSFRGGAADLERRLGRVRFLAELLEEYAFRMEIHEDTALARLEGLEMKAMAEKLKIVGYLIMHTRQLDMIMASSASVNYYRRKMSRDIEKILSTAPEKGLNGSS